MIHGLLGKIISSVERSSSTTTNLWLEEASKVLQGSGLNHYPRLGGVEFGLLL
jgi:hypothetical protein